MPKYDYTNSTIDRSDKKRLHFYEEVIYYIRNNRKCKRRS